MTVWARYMGSVVVVSALLNPWTVPGLFAHPPAVAAGRALGARARLDDPQLHRPASISSSPRRCRSCSRRRSWSRCWRDRCSASGPGRGVSRRSASASSGFWIITRPGSAACIRRRSCASSARSATRSYGISTRILADASFLGDDDVLFRPCRGRADHAGAAGRLDDAGVVARLARLDAGEWAPSGRWGTGSDPRPCARAGGVLAPFIYGQIVWMTRARLSRSSATARPLDARRRLRRHRLGAVPALSRAGAERRGAAGPKSAS